MDFKCHLLVFTDLYPNYSKGKLNFLSNKAHTNIFKGTHVIFISIPGGCVFKKCTKLILFC